MPKAAFISKTRFFVAKLSLRHYTHTVKESKNFETLCLFYVNSVLDREIIESAKL